MFRQPTPSSSPNVHAIGPCVLYAGQCDGGVGAQRLELALWRSELNF